MERLLPLRSSYQKSGIDWPDGSLDEKQNYILELRELEAQVTGMLGVRAGVLVHEIRDLRGQSEEAIIPAQQKRNLDHWL